MTIFPYFANLASGLYYHKIPSKYWHNALILQFFDLSLLNAIYGIFPHGFRKTQVGRLIVMHMNKLTINISLLLLFLFVAITSPFAGDNEDFKLPSLLFGKWRFIGFQNNTSGARDLFPIDVRHVFIEFRSTDVRPINNVYNFTGESPCNLYGGKFSTDNNRISISQTVSTERACERINKLEEERSLMEWERLYFATLRKATTYEIKDDELRINFNEGKGTLIYKRSAD